MAFQILAIAFPAAPVLRSIAACVLAYAGANVALDVWLNCDE